MDNFAFKDEENNSDFEEIVEKKSASVEYHDDFSSHKGASEDEGPWLVSYADLMTLLMGFFALIVSMSKPDVEKYEQFKKSTAETMGSKYVEPYKDLEKELREAMERSGLSNQVTIERKADGVSLKFEGKSLFDSGSYVLNDQGVRALNVIVDAIESDISKYKVQIEGHTDDVPISDRVIASNWELSAIRASRAALILERRGFSKQQLAVQGWGETKPEVPNTDAQGAPIETNRAKNRRIILKIFE